MNSCKSKSAKVNISIVLLLSIFSFILLSLSFALQVYNVRADYELLAAALRPFVDTPALIEVRAATQET
jgi:hypothetical protein